ncbi:MAG: helix-turn-helix transcriptional regulator [Victivallales bacterium]|nr:helix-turn-helix transcriptional regulator [Victivallales bacterium]
MRLYQKQYRIIEPMEAFPQPGELVEELQAAPYYRIDENMRRPFSGGQFSLTIEGEGFFEIAGHVTALKPGDGFLALHGEKDVSYYYPPEGKSDWVFLWISFMGTASERVIREINNRYGHIFHMAANGRLVSELRAQVRRDGLLSQMTPGKAAEASFKILGALLDSKFQKNEQSPENVLIARFQEFVLENINHDFGVANAAEALSVSREHLSRVVARKMRVSPAAYIRGKRMREARHLLLETNLACSDISNKLGFASPASFSRTFKAVTNTTPERYRSKQ